MDWLEMGVDPDEYEPDCCDKCEQDLAYAKHYETEEIVGVDCVGTFVEIEVDDESLPVQTVPGTAPRDGWDMVISRYVQVCPKCDHLNVETYEGNRHRASGKWVDGYGAEREFLNIEGQHGSLTG